MNVGIHDGIVDDEKLFGLKPESVIFHKIDCINITYLKNNKYDVHC